MKKTETVAEKDVNVLGTGNFLTDASSGDATWLLERGDVGSAAVEAAIAAMTAAERKKRHTVHALLAQSTAAHALMYMNLPTDPMYVMAALRVKYDPHTPEAAHRLVTQFQQLSILDPKHKANIVVYNENFENLRRQLVTHGETKTHLTVQTTCLKGLRRVQLEVESAVAQVQGNPQKFYTVKQVCTHVAAHASAPVGRASF